MTQNKVITLLLVFQLIILIPGSTYGDSKLPAVIEGRIIAGGVHDTVSIFFIKEFIYHYVGGETYKVGCDKNGYFKFTFNIEHFAAVTMYHNDSNLLFHDIYIQPGDNVYATFATNVKRSIRFSGNGSENFRCMYALDSCRNAGWTDSLKYDDLAAFNDPFMNRITEDYKSMDRNTSRLLFTLSAYRNTINYKLYQLLFADIMGDVYTSKCNLLSYFLKDATQKQKKQIALLFFNEVFKPKEKFNDSIAVYSDNYIEYLLRKSQKKLELKSTSGTYSMKQMDSLLSNDYTGLILDRILTSYLLRGNIGVANDVYQYCLNSAISKMESPVHKKYLLAQLERFSRGSMAFSFSLPDTSGRYVSLNEFRGKVILIDFWFNGCGSCISLSKDIEKNIMPKYNDSSFACISISLDKDKKKWLKGIGTGLYNGKRSINLYTEGLAFDHPLARYYNIQGCPTLLLIDRKGRIYSAIPPREPAKLSAEINDALQKK